MDQSEAAPRTPGARPPIAERLWEGARIEFSVRGYHGARVQGIARRAGCNVALLYRHWTSKKALYLEVLRTVWANISGQLLALMEGGRGAAGVVDAYLEANMRDPVGAQILIREFLDGAPFYSQLVAADPGLMEPIRRAARAISSTGPHEAEVLHPGLEATMSVLAIGGLAALVASAHETARTFVDQPITPEIWRRHLSDLLLHGVMPCPPAAGGGGATSPSGSEQA